MANANPPTKNQTFVFFIALKDYANPGKWKSSPTLAAGDFKVQTDGGTEANLNTLPTVAPASSRHVKVTVSSTEMNGDQLQVLWEDQTVPPEWEAGGYAINTTA